MVLGKRSDIVERLQTEILRLERSNASANTVLDLDLGPINDAFPSSTFPLAAIHEFLSSGIEDAAASCGFIGGLLASLLKSNGAVLWISAARTLFPPALRILGIQPEQIIFIDLKRERDVLWAMDEALKCGALTAVVGEMTNIGFTESRRLQLAVEQSQVTGFILRHGILSPTTTACVSRWKITALPSHRVADLPGVGFPRIKVELLRMRNGKSGSWELEWREGRFVAIEPAVEIIVERKKAG